MWQMGVEATVNLASKTMAAVKMVFDSAKALHLLVLVVGSVKAWD
jgi:hypothetical protein